MEQVRLGGYSGPKPADKEVEEICAAMRLQVERKTGQNYKVFTAVLYRTQVVAGMNFFIKVFVGATDYIHIIVYRNLQGEMKVTGVQQKHTKGDPLEPFDPPAEASS